VYHVIKIVWDALVHPLLVHLATFH